MARPCSVCTHPSVEDINAALVEGESTVTVAARYSPIKRVSRTAVERHKREDIPEALWRSQRVRQHTEADALMSRVLSREGRADRLYDAAWGLYEEARVTSDPDVALRAIGEARKCLGEARQTAALLFGRRDVRDLEEKLDAFIGQMENEKQRRGVRNGF